MARSKIEDEDEDEDENEKEDDGSAAQPREMSLGLSPARGGRPLEIWRPFRARRSGRMVSRG